MTAKARSGQREIKKDNKSTSPKGRSSTAPAEEKSKFEDYLILKFDGDRLLRYSITDDPDDGKIDLENPVRHEITTLKEDEEGDGLEQQIDQTGSKFAKFLYQFSENIKGFYHLINVTSFVRVRLRKNYIDTRLIEYATGHLHEIEVTESIKIFGISSEQQSEVRRRAREVSEFLEGMRQLPGLLLLGLVARFDAQISSFVRLLLKDRPEAIGSRESEFDLATLLNFADIDDLKDFFIDQEIYKLMHASHHEQMEFIEKTFHIKIRDKIDGYAQFLEVFERRNLVAHGEGLVNSRYESRCKLHKVEPDHRLKAGEEIALPPTYLLSATDIIYKFGILLIWPLWMKRHKEEMELAYSVMVEVTFELMSEERFQLVSSILGFLLRNRMKNADEAAMRIMAVNKAICEKRLNALDWRSSIDEYQWGVCTTNFQICVAAVDEDVEKVCALMRAASSENITRENRVTSSNLREWPAFHWVRKELMFQNKFKEVFGEDLSPTGIEQEEDASAEAASDSVH